MKVLITGGAGFIGINLAKKLLSLGYEVVLLDNFYNSKKNKIKNFNFIEHDIREKLSLNENFDYIYNLACPASPPIYQIDPIYTLETSFIGVKNMLDFALEKNAVFLQASTSEIYGNPLVSEQTENYLGNVNTIGPRACYDEGKRIAETLCFDYKRKYNSKIRLPRIFNTYGPHMDKNDGRVVSNFINQAIRNEDITIYGDGSQTRSFCYIDDLVNGLIKLMDSNYEKPINLGNPNEFTILELANKVIEMTDSKSKIIFMDLPEDDPLIRRPNIDIAKKELLWKPSIQLEEGLLKTIEYYRKDL